MAQPKANNAYKYRAYPTEDQRILIAKTFGCCCYYWNAIIEDSRWIQEQTSVWITPEPAEYKRIKSESFLKEVDSYAFYNTQQAYRQALKNHFKNPKHYGLPTFHARQGLKGSYKTNYRNDNIRFENGKLRLPKLGLLTHRRMPQLRQPRHPIWERRAHHVVHMQELRQEMVLTRRGEKEAPTQRMHRDKFLDASCPRL